jgi:hypothetical protein
MLIQDDGRTSIPGVLEGGASVPLLLSVQAPNEPGTYICECDLVHEGISWFGDRGSSTLRICVRVSGAGGSDAARNTQGISGAVLESEFPEIYPMLRPQGEIDLPSFPMNGVPHLTVLELVRRHGGEVFLAENDERGGPEWQGYRYFVVRM